jgi:SsrA-binding protein
MEALSENRRAGFDYEILQTYEAGLELLGSEVKSVATGKANLAGAYAIIRGEEVFIVGMDIPPYQPKNIQEEYDSQRVRKLLLNKEEIDELAGRVKQERLTIVGLKLYKKGPRIKLLLGLGKSRQKADKREHLKQKEVNREIRKQLS